MSESGPTVGLFVTCLVDMFRPNVGFSAAELLERAGCRVVVPAGQTCCGQPAYNSGDRQDARAVARTVLKAFAEVDYVVAPSGSCAAMISKHYPELFADDPEWASAAQAVAAKTWELVAFLEMRQAGPVDGARYDGVVTYHDSCSGLRELGVKQQPRRLLGQVSGVVLAEMSEPETCCGFGGTFCIKYPDISDAMVGAKTADIVATNADTLAAGDLGCLMNMAGKLTRDGAALKAWHVAEILAGRTDGAAIGEDD